MEGEAGADGLPVAGDEALDGGGRKRRFASVARLSHRLVGRDEQLAHVLGPRLGVDLDQRLELAQMMALQKAWATPVNP